MPVYKQCISTCPQITVSAGYPTYPGGGAHGGYGTQHKCNWLAYSPKSGTVVTAHHWQGGTTGNDSWGNYIVVAIDDEPGNYFLAAHFTAQTHSVGEHLDAGQLIGTQGQTGNVTGTHTHWEYWVGGQSTAYRRDPAPMLGLPSVRGPAQIFDVEWDTDVPGPGPGPDPNPPGPGPDPDPGPSWGKIPVWLMFKMAEGGKLNG